MCKLLSLLLLSLPHSIWCWLLVRSLFSGYYLGLKKTNHFFSFYRQAISNTFQSMPFWAGKLFVMVLFPNRNPISAKFFHVFCTTPHCSNDHHYCNHFLLLVIHKLLESYTLKHCSCRSSFLCIHFSSQMDKKLSASKSFFCLFSRNKSGLLCCHCLYPSIPQDIHFAILWHLFLLCDQMLLILVAT